MADTPAHDDHEHADGCLCGHDLVEQESTLDRDLPPAAGGVQGDPKPRRPRKPASSKNGEA